MKKPHYQLLHPCVRELYTRKFEDAVFQADALKITGSWFRRTVETVRVSVELAKQPYSIYSAWNVTGEAVSSDMQDLGCYMMTEGKERSVTYSANNRATNPDWPAICDESNRKTEFYGSSIC